MRFTMFSVVALLVAFLTPSGVEADPAVPLVPSDGVQLNWQEAVLQQDCRIGHHSQMMFSFPQYTASGDYKYLVHPTETCDCPSGFHLNSIHTWLVFDQEEVPLTFDMYVDIEEAVWNEATQCWEPGDELCASGTASVTIQYAGWNEIAISIHDDCRCLCMDDWYFLSMHFPAPVPEAELGLGDAVADCVAYHNDGTGWTDWNTILATGCFELYGDAYCCDSSSPADGSTWGDVKNLFK